MIRISYQNSQTGQAWDVTTITTAATWRTQLVGMPASIDLTVLGTGEVDWENGGVLTVTGNGEKLFYGYVFRVSKQGKGTISIKAYDQIRYLKSKVIYAFRERRADEILTAMAADYGIKTGSIANTGHVIPKLLADGKTMLDIIWQALDETRNNTGETFYLWDDYGSLCLDNVRSTALDLVVGDASLATDYTYSSDIDGKTYNRIVITSGDLESKYAERKVYTAEDRETTKNWGTLQTVESVDSSVNAGQMKQRGDTLLELYNKPNRGFDISAISDLSVRAGRSLFVGISEIGMKQYFVVEEARHDLLKETMNMKLRVV